MSPTASLVVVAMLYPLAAVAFLAPTGPTLGPRKVIVPKEKGRSKLQRLDMASDNGDKKAMTHDGGNHEVASGSSSSSSSSSSAGSCDRASFLRNQGVLAAGAMGTLGLSRPVAAAGLFDVGQNDVIEVEQIPPRMVVGKTQSIKWSTVAPSIAAMRTEARERFSNTGAKGGREVTGFFNQTPEGADVLVGLEVVDAKNSPAVGDGFAASEVSPPGEYMRDDHASGPGMLPWITFMARIPKEGYSLKQPMSMFEVYSGTGGKEGVSMYAAVSKASE